MSLKNEFNEHLSGNEERFLSEAFALKQRIDGRKLLEYRKISLQFQRTELQSQAQVQLGRTRVLSIVNASIVAPYIDRPTEGFLTFNVELSPMASTTFEAGRTSILAVELARIVDRGIRDSKALDTEALAIIAGKKVWSIKCTTHVLDHGGNLVDAVCLGSIAALMHFRRPDVTVSGERVVVHSMDERSALPLSLHHIPVCISFSFYKHNKDSDEEPIFLIDPTDVEEKVMEGSISFTINSYRELCALHKVGGLPVSKNDILRCTNLAALKAVELVTLLKEQVKQADVDALEARRAYMRGRHFVDQTDVMDDQNRMAMSSEEHLLGPMTDYDILHAPIPIKDNFSSTNDSHFIEKQIELEKLFQKLEESNKVECSLKGLEVNAQVRNNVKAQIERSSAQQQSSLTASAMEKSVYESKSENDNGEDEDDEEEEMNRVLHTEFNDKSQDRLLATVNRNEKSLNEESKSEEDDDDDDDDLSSALRIKAKATK